MLSNRRTPLTLLISFLLLSGCSKAFISNSFFDESLKNNVDVLYVVDGGELGLGQSLVAGLRERGVNAQLATPHSEEERYVLTLEKCSKTRFFRTVNPNAMLLTGMGTTALLGAYIAHAAGLSSGILDGFQSRKVDAGFYEIVVGVITDTKIGTEVWRGKFVDKGEYAGAALMKYYSKELADMMEKDGVLAHLN